MKTSTSIKVSMAKQIWKVIQLAYKRLKRGISNSNLLNRPLNNAVRSLSEYEFSCSNSPAVKKRRRRSLHHHRYRVDESDVATAVQHFFDMANREEEVMPGFEGTPVRQLRVTDSPFPETKGREEEEAQISKAAEEFIRRFYGDLRRDKYTFESIACS